MALLFRVAGFLLRRAGVPLMPFVLAVALGGNLERSFRQALSLSDGVPARLMPGGIAALFLGLSGILVLMTTPAPAWPRRGPAPVRDRRDRTATKTGRAR
ncbi:hypothetical protein [Cereibacter sphaeroides]|uniref:hypothetical protein n=1 Tax=Cereibacter sphaeroides TaxID=1063 RepID=UPI0000665016|nr:hypothetical protein Rsph17029_3606 [Cereibacter sphaeroides ATCC 17029]